MKIAIIGAGPAGIYTTLLLESFRGEVHLFEQNKDIGEKLKTTGGGRMNVTNKVFTASEFSSYQPRFVERIFKNSHFDHRQDLLDKLGIEYQWEKNRAILKSQNAVAEVARLKARIEQQSNAFLHLNTKIESIVPEGNGFRVTALGQSSGDFFDRVVLTVGGMYRMGDMGDQNHIYRLPIQAEHTITQTSPSLCGLIFLDKPLRALAGISFVGKLTDIASKKSITDDLLLTHVGISGPAALDFSSFAGEKIELSFVSDISEQAFVEAFNRLRMGKNSIKKFLKSFLPQRLIVFHLERAEIDQEFIADLPKQKLQRLVESLFHYPIPDRRPNVYPGSWTTKGGVCLDEVQTKNFESKKVSGLYFAGEVLDFNGLCGGYNISFAMISAQIVADDLLA